MALVIPEVSNQYSLRIPSHRFRQGGRDVYYFALDLQTLDGLLPQRVEDNIVREANRRLTPSHAKNIQRYLDEKDNWLLGALMLGVAPNAVEFDPYDSDEYPDFGELRILTNRTNTLRIFDGQHRRRAIQDVLYDLSNLDDDRNADKLDTLRRASMTIVLYAEDEIKTLRQMFVDASQTKRIEAHTVTRFDQRDAFNLAAMWLSENSKLFAGRVDMERSSVPRASQNIIAINQLATTLKTMEVGSGRRVSRDLNDSYMLNLEDLYKRSLHWADEFMVAARKEYQQLVSGDVQDSEIPQLRSSTLAYNISVFRILAGCYRSWGTDDWQPLADFLRSSSLRPGYNAGSLLVNAGLVAPDGTLYGRRQETAGAIDYIVRKARASIG